MQKLNLFQKLIVFLTSTAGILSFGSYSAKLLTQYYFFDGPRFELREFVQGAGGSAAFQMTVPVMTLSTISFFTFLFFVIVSLVVIRPNYKQYGWFFISVVMFLVLVPFQVYQLLTYEIPLIKGFYYGGLTFESGMKILIESFRSLSGFPFILLSAYLGMIALFVFRPLSIIRDANKT